MQATIHGWIIGAALGAAVVASGLCDAQAAAARGGGKEAAETLPSFDAAPDKGRSVVFTNETYTAWLAPNGYLHAIPYKGGKPAGPPVRLFNPTFWGRDTKGGYVLRLEPDLMTPETDMPVRQPAGPVRFRFEAKKQARGVVEIVFEPRSVTIEVKFRPSASGDISTLRPSVYVPNLPGMKIGAIDTNLDVEAVCAGKVVEMMPDSKTTTTLGFAEDAGRPDPCPEWVVRGLWDEFAVRGKAGSKSETFQYWQYGGTKPAHGFGFMYMASKSESSRKVTVAFESPDAPAPAPDVPLRVPGPVRGRRP